MILHRVYLAGPEVFLEDVRTIAQQKLEICRRNDLEGVFPLDSSLDLANLPKREAGIAIYHSNRDLMDSCDCLIANMTPFRGPSMDVGTAFEMGYMIGQGKIVLGYTNVIESFVERTKAFYKGDSGTRGSDNMPVDPYGMAIEDFDLIDNLMLESAVVAPGFEVVKTAGREEVRYHDMRGFEACVQQAVQHFKCTVT